MGPPGLTLKWTLDRVLIYRSNLMKYKTEINSRPIRSSSIIAPPLGAKAMGWLRVSIVWFTDQKSEPLSSVAEQKGVIAKPRFSVNGA